MVAGDWDLRRIEELLPREIIDKIMGLAPPSPWKGPDHVAWELTSEGYVLVKLAYSTIVNNRATPQRMFKLVWNWRGPERIQSFLLLVGCRALLTNTERGRHHLASNHSCTMCRAPFRSNIHALRDYDKATAIWSRLVLVFERTTFFTLDRVEWVERNLS